MEQPAPPLGGQQMIGGGRGCDWAHWIRLESVRRTVLMVEVVMGVYLFLKQGWDQSDACLMSLGFTAQAALWESRSAAEWRAAWRLGPRLEITIEEWDLRFKEAAPEDVDDLSIIIHATMAGLDRLEEWLGGEREALVRWGLRERSWNGM